MLIQESYLYCIPEDDGRHGKAPRGSLKEFVEQYKDKHFHVIETRIVLICSFGIFMKLFYSDERELTLTHTNLLFLGCKLMGTVSISLEVGLDPSILRVNALMFSREQRFILDRVG